MARTNKFKKKPKPTATATGKPKSFPVPSKKHGIKHKTKKSSTSSLFGPLSAQQPRGLKWNLTASMGGASAGSKKSSTKKSNKKKLNTSTRHIKSGERQDQTQKVKSWTLNMPVVSQSDQVVPWLVSRRKRAPSSPSDQSHSNRIRKIHTGLSLPVASLANLNAELQSFSEYVKLNEAEISSRLSVVELIQSQCRHLFGVCPEACKVFGSFACLPVCNFISDVDMAIHDVVQAPPNSTENTTATTVIEIHDTESDDEDNHATPKRNTKRIKTETQSPHPNLKRQGRVLAWKKALEAAEEEKKQHLASRNMNSAKAKSEQMSAIAGAETMQQISSDSTSQTPLSRKYAPLRVELAESKPLPPTAVPNDEGLPLFVIDREGCPDINEKIQSPITPQDTDIPTVTDVSKESSIPSDEEEKKDEDEDVAHSRPVSDAKHLEDSDDDEEVTQQHDDDSDADTADVLAVLNQRKIHDSLGATTVVPQSVRAALTKDIDEESNNNDDNDDESEQEEELHVTKTRPRSRSLISLCSATTCSDTEEKDWDDSGMEVSFVSNASSTRTLPAGPTLDDDTRGKVIRALNSLSRRLRGNSLTSNIHVRKKAKVPIINMETRFGYECDIAIGGHNGTDTSSFASSQCNKFQR